MNKASFSRMERIKLRQFFFQGYHCVIRDSNGNLCPGYRHDAIERVLSELENPCAEDNESWIDNLLAELQEPTE